MTAPASELGWVVHFAPVVRFTPLSPTSVTFYPKILRNVEDIDVGNFRQKRFMLRRLGQWSKNFGFGSALFTPFWRCKYGVLFAVQTFNKHSRMAKLSQPYLRAMKRHKSIGPYMLRNVELKLWTPVNFEVEYFLNEETEGVLTDTVIYLPDQQLTWLSQLKPNAKVG